MSDFFHRTSLRVLVLSCLTFSIQLFAQQVRDSDKTAPVEQIGAAAQSGQSPARVHIVPWGPPAVELKARKTAAGQSSNNGIVQYYGGPVISNVQVVEVLWGSLVASAELNGTPPETIDTFFSDITQSNYFSLLGEYGTVGLTSFGTGTPGSNQKIGAGTFGGKFTITPSLCPGTTACSINDTQIQTEIISQLNGGHLPAAVQDGQGNFNTIYMIYFPPNVTISLDAQTKSCQRGGFCAYHSNVVSGSLKVPYGVFPDFTQGGCAPALGCGNRSAFDNLTGASSHELAEAVTDVDVGSATVLGPPLGWADQNSGEEIGDFCNQRDALVTVNSNTYNVQTELSNMQQACVSAPAHFQIQGPTNIAPTTQFQLTVTAASSVDSSALPAYSNTVHFTSSDTSATLPADYTFVPADSGSHNFLITLSTKGTQTVTATDTLMSQINASASVNVADNPDMTVTSAHSGNFTQGQTGATYTLTATNVGDQPTTATVSVVDNLPGAFTPTAMTGTGWLCTLATLTCTRSDALAAHSSYPTITLTVNVSNTAASPVTNSVGVSGGGEVNFSNDGFNDSTTINQLVDMTITKTHAGNFGQGQNGATYTITIGNIGIQGSSGTVTVVDGLPPSLTATSMAGTGWNCTISGQPTCTRNDSLASNSQFPPITLTVNVSASAPPSVINSATVSGGGETNSNNDIANDLTNVVPAVSLSLASANSQTVSAGGSAVYTFNVNSGGGTVTFACTGLPQVSSCLFSPPTITGSASTNLTITTTKGGSVMPPASGDGPRPLWLLVMLAMLATAELLRRSTRRTMWRPAMGLAGVVAMMMLASCGGSHPPPPQPGTPPGTYQVTVTATNSSTNAQATAQVTLVVQ